MRIVARRLALPAAAVAAALALTACQSTDGTSAAPTQVSPAPTSAAPTPTAEQSAEPTTDPTPESTGTPTAKPSQASQGSQTSKPVKPSQASKPSQQTKPSQPAAGGSDAGTTRACTAATTKIVASKVSRPVNHLVLTVTNVGSRPCNALNAPLVGFDDAQAPIGIVEGSKPQAAVTLAPGESGYASVILTGEPGPDTNGRTVRKIRVNLTPESSTTVTAPSGTFADAGAAVSYWQHTLEDALTY